MFLIDFELVTLGPISKHRQRTDTEKERKREKKKEIERVKAKGNRII